MKTDKIQLGAVALMTLAACCGIPPTPEPSPQPPATSMGMDDNPGVLVSVLTPTEQALPYDSCPAPGDTIDIYACNKTMTITVGSCDVDDGIMTVRGETEDGGQVYIASGGSSASGTIRQADSTYVLMPADGEQVLCQQLDPSTIPDEPESEIPVEIGDEVDQTPTERIPTIDLLFIFPQKVRKIEYGIPNISRNAPFCGGEDVADETTKRQSVVNTMVDSVNPALWNQAVIGAAHHQCVQYTASCTTSEYDQECIDRPLRWMLFDTENHFFEEERNTTLESARNEASADVVVMVLPISYHAGAANTLPESALLDSRDYSEYGYLVVNQTYAAGHYSLAHELGHVMGLRHDRAWYGTCSIGGKGTGECNYGSMVIDPGGPTANEPAQPLGYTIMATSSVCDCFTGGEMTNTDAEKECAKHRNGVFSRADTNAEKIFGFQCESGQADGPYNRNVDAYRYLRRGAEIVSKYRDPPPDD